MKGLKRGILAFFFGQLLTLWRKDTKLKKAVVKEPNLGNKVKLMGQALLDFNKGIVEDAKQVDLQAQWLQTKEWIEEELTDLQTKLHGRESEAKTYSQEQVGSVLKEIEARYDTLLAKTKAWIQQLEEHPELTQKIATVHKTIAKIKQVTSK